SPRGRSLRSLPRCRTQLRRTSAADSDRARAPARGTKRARPLPHVVRDKEPARRRRRWAAAACGRQAAPAGRSGWRLNPEKRLIDSWVVQFQCCNGRGGLLRELVDQSLGKLSRCAAEGAEAAFTEIVRHARAGT